MTGEYLTNFSTGQLDRMSTILSSSMSDNFVVAKANMASLYSLLVSPGAIRVMVVVGVIMVVAVVALKYPFL